MGRVGSDGRSPGQTSGDATAARRASDRSSKVQFMGPQDETLDRLLGRTEAEMGAAKTCSSWSLFSVLRAAYQTQTSDPTR